MTIDRSFFPEPEPLSVARIIELGNCFLRKGSPDFTVKDVGALDEAASDFLVFASNKKVIQELKSANGYALICTQGIVRRIRKDYFIWCRGNFGITSSKIFVRPSLLRYLSRTGN